MPTFLREPAAQRLLLHMVAGGRRRCRWRGGDFAPRPPDVMPLSFPSVLDAPPGVVAHGLRAPGVAAPPPATVGDAVVRLALSALGVAQLLAPGAAAMGLEIRVWISAPLWHPGFWHLCPLPWVMHSPDVPLAPLEHPLNLHFLGCRRLAEGPGSLLLSQRPTSCQTKPPKVHG
jgi:hypothetical protein